VRPSANNVNSEPAGRTQRAAHDGKRVIDVGQLAGGFFDGGWRIFDEARRRRLQGAEQRLRNADRRRGGKADARIRGAFPISNRRGPRRRVALFEGFNEARRADADAAVTRSFHRAQAGNNSIVEIDARRCATRTVNVEALSS